jgi:hypothetical protein
MLGFLFKLILLLVVVGGAVGYGAVKYKTSPVRLVFGAKTQMDKIFQPQAFESAVRGISTKEIVSQVSTVLDSLVTKGTSDSPVVLGLKVTNESLNAVTDVLQKLPADQLGQIKNVLCASPSAN